MKRRNFIKMLTGLLAKPKLPDFEMYTTELLESDDSDVKRVASGSSMVVNLPKWWPPVDPENEAWD